MNLSLIHIYVIEKEYGGKIHNIDFSYLPATGKPSRSLTVPTPEYNHTGGIVFYEKGDYVKTDGLRDKFYVRDAPAGNYVHGLSPCLLYTSRCV